jgi:deuterolysin
LTSDDAFVTIPAGGSVSVIHSLGANYDFNNAGAGTYSFATEKTRFQTSDNKILNVEVNSVDVEVTEVEETFGTQTTTPTCSDSGQKALLATILAEARALAGGAATDINSHPNSGQFATYFGNNDRGAVWWQFDAIAGDLPERSGNRMCVWFSTLITP